MSDQIAESTPHNYQRYLQCLPTDWSRKEIRQIGTVVGGGTPSRDVSSFWRGNIPWATPGEVSGNTTKFLYKTKEHISASGLIGSGANLLPPHSLMVTTRATLGARAVNAVAMATNQGFKSIAFRQAGDSSFYFHVFEKVQPELVRRASGTTFLEISAAEFAGIEVPSPSPDEKSLITEILDTLDTAIHETEAIIAKLEAVKLGLLHDLLTRGIDSNGELRPPQAEAPHLYKESQLGWIPKEWMVKAVHELGEVVTGSTPPSIDPLAWGFGVPFVTPGDLDDGVKVFKTERQISERGHRYVRLLPAGSSLVVCIGSTIGKVGISSEIVCTNQQINAVVPAQGTNHTFLFYSLQRLSGRLQALAGLQAVPIVNKSSFEAIKLACPPHVEQVEMSQRILAVSDRLQIEKNLLEKLQQQKVGLIDDLLTGRVRVTALLSAEQQGGK
jgi:type I restriction enzyme S subunit